MASPASNASRTAETGGSAGSNTRPAADVTVVTTRDDFLLELGESLDGQASVRPVESMSAALENLGGKRAQILAIDARDIEDVRAEVERVRTESPHTVVLVFGAAENEKQLAAAVKGSNVFAVLPIPLDKRKTGAVFEGAVADAVARKTPRAPERAPEAPRPLSIEPFQAPGPGPAHSPPSDSGSDSKGRLVALIGAGIAVVAVAAGAYLYFGRGRNAAPPPAAPKAAAAPAAPASAAPSADDASLAPQPAVDTSLVAGKVDDLLEKARLAMRERRYSEPAGDNALLYYRSAAAADAANGEALDGLQRVATVLAARFEESISASHLDDAASSLANFKQAVPTDSRIGSFDLRLTTAQISKALADGNLDRAAALVRIAQQSPAIPADQISRWRADIGRRQEDAKVQHIAGLISDRIRDGRLVDPADDSAKSYMQQLHDAAPANAATQRLTRDLNAAYLRKAREATLASHPQESDRWLSEARAGGVSASDIQSFQKDLAGARQKALGAESDRLAQSARDRIRDGRLTDPAQDSAAYFIGQIQSADASNAAIPQLSRDLAAKLLERARASAQAGKSAQAEADLAQAKRWGADPKDLSAVQQMETASRGTGAAASRSGGADPSSLASSLKRTRYYAPEYPSRALSEHLSGSVVVEYTVDTHGDTRDIRITDSTPPGVFDRAAIAAVKHWHYDPAVANGVPVEVPVRTAIRFELPK